MGRRDIDKAGTCVAKMQDRSEKFLHLAEVLEDAVTKALRTGKDVAVLSTEVKRIDSDVASLACEFGLDKEGQGRRRLLSNKHNWSGPELLRSTASADTLRDETNCSDADTDRVRELLETTSDHLLRATRELTT